MFNLDKPILPGDDRGKYRKFLEDGGMIAITDETYPGVRSWLTATLRIPFQSADGKVQGLYCTQSEKDYVLLVNGTTEKFGYERVIPGSETMDRKLRDFFQKKDDVLTVSQNRFKVTLEPYETRVYWSE